MFCLMIVCSLEFQGLHLYRITALGWEGGVQVQNQRQTESFRSQMKYSFTWFVFNICKYGLFENMTSKMRQYLNFTQNSGKYNCSLTFFIQKMEHKQNFSVTKCTRRINLWYRHGVCPSLGFMFSEWKMAIRGNFLLMMPLFLSLFKLGII